LSRHVEDKQVVDDISVSVAWGDVLAIVGPSGAGKSSFLRLINRLDEPTGGTVYLEGQDYRKIPPRDLRERVGMVMQAPYLFPGTVAENIRFGPQQRGEVVPPERIEMLLDRVGLRGYEERDVQFLSGGEAQRVSLARTLANSPEVLLLDEPTSALDEAAQRDVEQLVVQIIRQERLTCLIVTHDLGQAERMAERAMLMRNGRLVKVGPIAEVIHA
jgi:putative ABC transport system ATP-binding protein